MRTFGAGVSKVKAASAYFALVFGAGFVLGSIRVPILVPRLGVRQAELLEMPLMLASIVWSARFAVRRFAVPPSACARLIVGGLALAALIVAELTLTYQLQGLTPARYAASRDPVSGGVYLLMLGLFALMPLIIVQAVTLRTVKVTHTAIWALFAGCIVALPLVVWHQRFGVAMILIALVSLEVLVLLANRLRCPLTDIAARYTEDRQDNFDIYLPLWLARHNKQVFGALFVGGVLYTAISWYGAGQ